MASPAPWPASAPAFAEAFAMSSLVSGITYWLARHPSTFMHSVRVSLSGVASSFLLLLFVAVLAKGNGHYALLVLLAITGSSALQAVIEGTLNGEALTAKQRFARSFFSYLCPAFIWCCLVAIIFATIFSDNVTAWLGIGLLLLITPFGHLEEALGGYALGLLIAPFSISFFRRMFQTIALRPGIDRPFSEDELVG